MTLGCHRFESDTLYLTPFVPFVIQPHMHIFCQEEALALIASVPLLRGLIIKARMWFHKRKVCSHEEKMKLFFVVVFLTGVTISACANWAPTLKAQIRREAAWRLNSCIFKCTDVPACERESIEWCKSKGMEPSCGLDDLWSSGKTCQMHKPDGELTLERVKP